MSRTLQRLGLYLRTIRWLRLSQLCWFAYRRLRGVINPPEVAGESSRETICSIPFARPAQPDQCELRFLSVSAPADPAGLDWHPANKSRLWRYNLHYFDYLRWDAIPGAFKPAYLDSWIEANPTGCEDAWEPYTVSLRIVNWIKYFQSSGAEVPEAWQTSLLNQANWLLHNIEYHILANHLYKNAKALVFAGAWFTGPCGRRLLDTGLRLFMRETNEQILPDGGHYERTPTYHCIVLEDLLDVLNLMQTVPSVCSASERGRVSDAALLAARFIDGMVCADGDIPLFNDSALDIAPGTDDLLSYAERVVGYERLAPPRQPMRVAYADSGYYGYRHNEDSFLIDCGRIGPDYQPGHTHCDMLSYELRLDGARVVVDSGVHGYESDDLRGYVRSTAAHNTLVLDGAEQSEIWGTFRVARRAEPIAPRLSQIEDNQLSFQGGHDGYHRLPQKALHHRRVDMDLGRSWQITDTVEGQGSGTAESYIHFAPDLTLQPTNTGAWSICRGDRTVAQVTVNDGCEARVEEAEVAHRFGQREPVVVLVVARAGALPLRLGYTITRLL